jgi:iron complex outermembrane receptor protein
VVGKDYGKSAGFGVFSLNGAYRINKNLKVSTGVDNLFGKAYAEHLNLAGNAGFGYPDDRDQGAGRTLWTKVDMSFWTKVELQLRLTQRAPAAAPTPDQTSGGS